MDLIHLLEVLRGSISVHVEELTRTDRLMAVWGHIPTQEAPGACHQLSAGVVVMSPQRGVFRGKSVLEQRVVVVVVVVMLSGLLACGLVHHRSGAIRCNIYQLTQGTSG